MTTTVSASRIALIAAALVASGAIGFSIWRGQTAAPPPTSAAPPTASIGGTPADAAAAITQIEAALKANPNDARGWRVLGSAHREAGNFGESVTALRRATALEPDNAEGWALLGEALALSAPPPMPADARAAFRKALDKDANEPLAAYYLAIARDMDGDHKGAIDDWFALLDRSPAGSPWIPEVRNTITRVAAANKIDVAKRLAAAKDLAPAPPAKATPGRVADPALARREQDAMVAQMVDGLAAKLETNPKDVDGWVMLMRSRVALKQDAQARQALATAKAANPGDAAKLDQAARAMGL
jgi:cytochrome c-type biogenesis protein CcmH